MFDNHITPGDILTFLGFIVFITLYISNSRSMNNVLGTRLNNMEIQMSDMTKEMKKLAEIAATQARMDERTLGDGRRIDEIERRFNRLSEKVNEVWRILPIEVPRVIGGQSDQ